MNQSNTQSLNTKVIVANTTQGEQHIHTISKTQYILKDVEVLSRERVGDDLIIKLKNGNTLIFHDYYKTQSLVTIEDTEATEGSNTSLLMTLPLSALGDSGGDAKKNMIVGSDGVDYLFGTAGDDAIYGELGNDFLYGEGGNDELYGGDGEDRLEGGAGNDTLYGGAGHDHDTNNGGIYGGDGNDILYGGTGVDTLHGDDGDDELYGGEGHDMLYGDAGNDTFYYTSTNDGHDKIYDFTMSDDKIDLSALLTYNSATDNIDDFVTITYHPTIGDAIIKIDVNGDGSGTDVSITLAGYTSIDLATMITNGNIILE